MPDMQRHFAEMFALENLTKEYTNKLEQVDPGSLESTWAIIVARSFAAVSIILLHRRFTSHDQNSRRKCLAAANVVVTILDALNIQNPVYIDAVMAVSIFSGNP